MNKRIYTNRWIHYLTVGGICYVDDEKCTAEEGNEHYKNQLRFNDVARIDNLETEQDYLESIAYFERSIDPYVDYIEDGRRWDSAVSHNHKCQNMVHLLKQAWKETADLEQWERVQ